MKKSRNYNSYVNDYESEEINGLRFLTQFSYFSKMTIYFY